VGHCPSSSFFKSITSHVEREIGVPGPLHQPPSINGPLQLIEHLNDGVSLVSTSSSVDVADVAMKGWFEGGFELV
jgi:hypothetical protein